MLIIPPTSTTFLFRLFLISIYLLADLRRL